MYQITCTRKKGGENTLKTGELSYLKDTTIETINNYKIIRCKFCSIEKDCEHCADLVEKDFRGLVWGKRVGEEKHEFATCLICGNPAICTVYIARSY